MSGRYIYVTYCNTYFVNTDGKEIKTQSNWENINKHRENKNINGENMKFIKLQKRNKKCKRQESVLSTEKKKNMNKN